MASNPDTSSTSTATRFEAPPLTARTVGITALAWLVPGAGHLLQRRWWRGVLLAVSIVAMFVFGILMQGKVYSPNTGDVLDMLGFLGDLGSGALYLVTKAFGLGHSALEIAAADYGTKFIIVAGLLNIISMVDAYDIAIGKKS